MSPSHAVSDRCERVHHRRELRFRKLARWHCVHWPYFVRNRFAPCLTLFDDAVRRRLTRFFN